MDPAGKPKRGRRRRFVIDPADEAAILSANSDAVETPEDPAQKKKAKNTKASRDFRYRRRVYVITLQASVAVESAQSDQLKQVVASLESEGIALRQAAETAEQVLSNVLTQFRSPTPSFVV